MAKTTLELDEIAAQAKALNEEKFAIDCKLTKLAIQKEEIKKRDFLTTFREMVKPITWAPELTESLTSIKLTAWTDTWEEQEAKFAVIRELKLSDTVTQFSFPERGAQINLYYGDLYITVNRIENLHEVISHYGLRVEDCSDTVQEIDEKIPALSWLKSALTKSIKE